MPGLYRDEPDRSRGDLRLGLKFSQAQPNSPPDGRSLLFDSLLFICSPNPQELQVSSLDGSFCFRTLLYCFKKFVESLGEESHSVVGKFVGHLFHGNANFGRGFHGSVGRLRRFRSGWCAAFRGRGRRPGSPVEWCPPCPARSILRRRARRDRLDSWCWCWPRARVGSGHPWQPGLSSDRCRRWPILLVSLLAVRDRNLPCMLFNCCCSSRVFGSLELGAMMASTSGINAADEEAGHAGHLADIATARRRISPGPRCRLLPPSRKPLARRAGLC